MPKVIEDLEFRLSEEARRQVERSGCAAYCVHPLRLPPGWIPGLP